MKIAELRKKTTGELAKEALEIRSKLVEAALKVAAGEYKTTHEIKVMRRQRARILTIQNEANLNAPKV